MFSNFMCLFVIVYQVSLLTKSIHVDQTFLFVYVLQQMFKMRGTYLGTCIACSMHFFFSEVCTATSIFYCMELNDVG